MAAEPSSGENAPEATASLAARATRFNRSELEAAMVRRAQALGLEYRFADIEWTWLRRDFNVSLSGSQQAINEFAEWLSSLREGAGDNPGPAGA